MRAPPPRRGTRQKQYTSTVVVWLAILGHVALSRPQQVTAAPSERVVLQLAASVSSDASRRLASAISGQLVDLAHVERASPRPTAEPQSALCAVHIEQSTKGLTLRFVDESGRALAPARVLAASPRELAASEVATIVRAFVVALLERRNSGGAPVLAAADPGPEAAPQAVGRASGPEPSLLGALAGSQSPAPPAASSTPAPSASAAQPTKVAPPPAAPPDRKPAAGPPSAKPGPTPSELAAAAAAPPATSRPAQAGEPPAVDNGAPTPRTAEPTPAVPVQQTAPRTARAPAQLWLTTFYTGTIYAPELSWLDGFRVEGAWRFHAWLYAGVGYGFHAPAHVGGAPDALATVRIHDHNLSGWAGVGRTGELIGWGIEVAVGLTDTLRHTESAAGQLAPTDDSASWSAMGALRLRGRMRVPGLPRLLLELAPAVELAREPPLAVDDGEEIPILSPHTVRGRLDVGASVEFF